MNTLGVVGREVAGAGTAIGPRIGALDGLRGIAIVAVLAFHFGVPFVPGGFLGVDVFFVLSGFLITSLLVAEWDREGRIDLRRFWMRRARRLLPGLAIVLGVIASWAAVRHFANPLSVRSDAIATLGYVANWRFVLGHRGYFAQYGAPSPLAHTWSLAIEEQFYVVWPLMAIPILRRWGARGLRNAAAIGATASAGLCVGLLAVGTTTARLYFGTDTRAQAILVGAALAAHLGLGASGALPRRMSKTAALVGIGVLVEGFHALGGAAPALYSGGFTAVALAAAAVIARMVTEPAGLLSRVLSWRPLQAAGVVSYELYLWHWPVLVGLTSGGTGLKGSALLAARLLVTVTLAAASWVLIDNPVRTGRLRVPRRRTLRIASMGIAVAAVVIFVALLGTGPSTTPVAGAAVPPQHDHTADPGPRLAGRPPVHAVLLGDSVALTLGEGLLDRAPGFGVDFVDGGLVGCGVLGGGPIRLQGAIGDAASGCARWEAGWRRLVEEQHPEVVAILVGRWEVIDRRFEGRWTHIGEPSFDAFITAQLDLAITAAASSGGRVVVLTSPHFEGVERPDGGSWPEDDPSRVDRFNHLLTAAVARHGPRVTLLDLGAIAEPAGRYTPSINGITVRQSDGVHFTQAGADVLAPAVLTELLRVANSP
ncbi:MAG: acyltransferase family protein [Acidimicrobiales bacterium]